MKSLFYFQNRVNCACNLYIYYLYTEILNFLLSFSKLMQFITATLLQKLPVAKRNPI